MASGYLAWKIMARMISGVYIVSSPSKLQTYVILDSNSIHNGIPNIFIKKNKMNTGEQ
jgi:hypothetical protein